MPSQKPDYEVKRFPLSRRLIIDSATTLPYVCLLALDHDEIKDAQPASWNGEPGRALAVSFARDGHDANLVFLPKDLDAWLRAFEQVGFVPANRKILRPVLE